MLQLKAVCSFFKYTYIYCFMFFFFFFNADSWPWPFFCPALFVDEHWDVWLGRGSNYSLSAGQHERLHPLQHKRSCFRIALFLGPELMEFVKDILLARVESGGLEGNVSQQCDAQ